MTKTGFRSALVVLLTLLFASAGHADDEEKSGTREGVADARRDVEEPSAGPSGIDFTLRFDRAAALAPAAGQSFSMPSGRQMELFGRLGLASVNVTAEDSFGIGSGGPGDVDVGSLSASRRVSEFGWGGGARLMSGSWGIEGTYSVFDSLALSPGWLVADEAEAGGTAGLLDLPLVASKADVFVGQVIRGFALSRTTELFVGLGAGWMRATDSSTDRLLSGAGFPDPEEITGALPPDVPPEFVASFVPEVEFTANRSSVVFAGSLGLSFRAGRILLRPRLDVIIARALTTELTVGFPGLADLGLPETEELGVPEFSYTTSVTPRIYLLSVDVGLSN
ncbi:MAG: hypothetical protein OYL41_11640 [Acidobacteriota bacterium]|nr:hypothetical protein [Acidobacteriota bacterium]MDE3262622.1 hypothetical protein [Acidobacteriota bacterium]